ncbi:C-X-C motif chemokine 11 [Arvicola amphibius]|uniref:C-X-C motif chemokine 11 n=1 Tax=Arvicola amphibius TaxID=1047088 RepID=UPI0018E364B6|nr:C-X-C motif chemokine 11 [Arvicola amphibius]
MSQAGKFLLLPGLLVYKMLLLQPSHCSLQSTSKPRQNSSSWVDMKGMAMAFAVLICATTVQGFTMFRVGRCLCLDPGVKAVRMADIEKVSIIYPTRGCAKVEVIVTLKANKGERCLNPKSKQARIIQQAIERKNSSKRQNHVKS